VLSNPGVEKALYESPVLRRFAGIDLGHAQTPQEITLLNFRHLLEEDGLCGQMPDTVNLYLDSKGIRTTFGGFAAGRADLYQFRFLRHGLFHVCIQLGRVAFRIGAAVGMSHVLEEHRLVPGALGAVKAGTHLGHTSAASSVEN
jgi:IS5 family transposase